MRCRAIALCCSSYQNDTLESGPPGGRGPTSTGSGSPSDGDSANVIELKVDEKAEHCRGRVRISPGSVTTVT